MSVSARDSERLKEEVLRLGATLVGLADMGPVAPLPYPDLTQAISVAVQLTPGVIEAVRQGPTREYAVEYDRVNDRLDQIAEATCVHVRGLGYAAERFPASVYGVEKYDPVYLRDLRVKFQHKTAATRAGLGWIGKAAILVTPGHGPRVRLATVFTDMPLVAGQPVIRSRCGGCTECVDACPGGVIAGRHWEVGVAREVLINPHRCQEASKQVSMERTGQQGPCGICVAVCPWGYDRRLEQSSNLPV